MTRALKILCVDDERLFLSSFRRFFLDTECDLLLADTTARGWQLLAENQPVQMVLSDYRMPEENGLEFLLRVAQRWPETVRLIVSGYIDITTVTQALNAGEIDFFVPKPWKKKDLEATIHNAIRLYAIRSETA